MPKIILFILSGEFPFIAYQVTGGCIGAGGLGANFQELPFTLELKALLHPYEQFKGQLFLQLYLGKNIAMEFSLYLDHM